MYNYTELGPTIYFYNEDDSFYQFTNFYRLENEMLLDEKLWKTTEHYFQAQKFIGTPYVEIIRNLKYARDAFNMSRKLEVMKWRRKDWEEVKSKIMYKALLAKFSQDEKLRLQLAHTGNRRLVEHAPYDSFWGDGYHQGIHGRNELGCLLMEVRKIIQCHPKDAADRHNDNMQSLNKDTEESSMDIDNAVKNTEFGDDESVSKENQLDSEEIMDTS